ncbi:MAG: DUF362 domain-containing protein [Deltaproteobacteria bacterium]|nr:DUF362 domain-containing protein [Deltaproteobacteria bacterium]
MLLCASESGEGVPHVLDGDKSPDSGRQTRVGLAGINRGTSEQVITQAVRAAAEAATDFSWLSKGDAGFIKPVNNSGKPYPSTTSPIAVAAMIEILKQKGAGRVIVGDMSGIQYGKLSPEGLSGSSRHLMERSGIAAAVKAAGGEAHFFEEAGWNAFYEDQPAPGSHWKRGLMMPNILKEVEHIILMPRCSSHVLAGNTLGMKAAVGYWRTDTRLEYHRDAATLQEKTAEGNTVETLRRKQRLVLSVANQILTTFGPDDGYVYQPDTGVVMASDSVVAHDMVSLAWLLENRRHIPPAEKGKFLNTSPFVVTVCNHWITYKLGGWQPALASERLTRPDNNTIWDDRTLNRAYQIFGGVPRVTVDAANPALPEELRKQLSEMTTYPA